MNVEQHAQQPMSDETIHEFFPSREEPEEREHGMNAFRNHWFGVRFFRFMNLFSKHRGGRGSADGRSRLKDDRMRWMDGRQISSFFFFLWNENIIHHDDSEGKKERWEGWEGK